MLDVLELEKKWSSYHFKKTFPVYIVSFVIAATIGLSSYIYIKYPDTVLRLLNEQTVHTEKSVIVEINNSIKPVQLNTVYKPKPSPRNVLAPSYNFIYNLEDDVINFDNAEKIASVSQQESVNPERVVTEPKTEPKPKPKKVTKPTQKPKKVTKKTPKPPVKARPVVAAPTKSKIVTVEPVQSIIIGDNNPSAIQEPQQPLVQVASTSTSVDELRSVIKRYNKNKNPALSLFISKKYYENGNFKESYVYAKETYSLNPNIEDGVLLFAQSSVKLGKNDDAIDTLELYIKNSGSIKAKTLLSEIQKGTFK